MGTCKITALCNQKGGVGKTTTTVNLGIGLAREGKKVLLVDADAQASLSLSLGYKNPDNLSCTLSDLMESYINDEPLDYSAAILHHDEGVDLIPASIELAGMEMELVNVMSRERVIKECLRPLRAHYDQILIDCMPSLGQLTLNALAASDSVIIPLQPAFLSVKGMDMLLSTIKKVRRQINPTLKIDGMLFTMVDSRTNEARDVMATLRYFYDGSFKIFDTEIPFSVRAAETSAKGKSIFLYDKNGKVANAYEQLSKEVISIGKRERLRSDTAR